MRGILTTWATCALLLASVSGVTSTSITTTPTPKPSTPATTPTPTPATTTSAPPPTTVTATTTTATTTNGTTGTTTTRSTGPTTTRSTGPTTTGTTGPTTTRSTGPTTTGTTGPTTTSGNTTTTNGTDVESTTPGKETTSNTTTPSVGTTVGIPTTTTASRGCETARCGNMPCLQLYNDYVCRCPINSIYDESIEGCSPGESLYGEVLLMNKDFEDNPSSAKYTAIYNELVNNFNSSISDKTSFLGTVILEMRLTSARNMRQIGNVLAKVTNIFDTGVNLTQVEQEIADHFKNQNLGTYTAKTVCESGWVCDPDTTTCTSDNAGYAVCSCKEGFYSSLLSPTACRECAPSCTEANGKQCVQGKTPKCSCLPGYKEKDGECKECSFGYSGDNCDDNFLLILVIVGSVLGGVVLILLGTVIGLAVKSGRRKGDSERAGLITKEDRRSPPASPQLGTIFPKVTMKPDLGEVNRGVNVYDDNEEYTRSMPQRDYDENPWYEMERRKRDY